MLSDVLDSEEKEALYNQIDEAPDDRYVGIDSFPSRLEYNDMVDFADSVTDESLQRLLNVALDGKGAFRRFKDVLFDFSAERDRWFEFRKERMTERILEWLEENELALAGEEEQ